MLKTLTSWLGGAKKVKSSVPVKKARLHLQELESRTVPASLLLNEVGEYSHQVLQSGSNANKNFTLDVTASSDYTFQIDSNNPLGPSLLTEIVTVQYHFHLVVNGPGGPNILDEFGTEIFTIQAQGNGAMTWYGFEGFGTEIENFDQAHFGVGGEFWTTYSRTDSLVSSAAGTWVGTEPFYTISGIYQTEHSGATSYGSIITQNGNPQAFSETVAVVSAGNDTYHRTESTSFSDTSNNSSGTSLEEYTAHDEFTMLYGGTFNFANGLFDNGTSTLNHTKLGYRDYLYSEEGSFETDGNLSTYSFDYGDLIDYDYQANGALIFLNGGQATGAIFFTNGYLADTLYSYDESGSFDDPLEGIDGTYSLGYDAGEDYIYDANGVWSYTDGILDSEMVDYTSDTIGFNDYEYHEDATFDDPFIDHTGSYAFDYSDQLDYVNTTDGTKSFVLGVFVGGDAQVSSDNSMIALYDYQEEGVQSDNIKTTDYDLTYHSQVIDDYQSDGSFLYGLLGLPSGQLNYHRDESGQANYLYSDSGTSNDPGAFTSGTFNTTYSANSQSTQQTDGTANYLLGFFDSGVADVVSDSSNNYTYAYSEDGDYDNPLSGISSDYQLTYNDAGTASSSSTADLIYANGVFESGTVDFIRSDGETESYSYLENGTYDTLNADGTFAVSYLSHGNFDYDTDGTFIYAQGVLDDGVVNFDYLESGDDLYSADDSGHYDDGAGNTADFTFASDQNGNHTYSVNGTWNYEDGVFDDGFADFQFNGTYAETYSNSEDGTFVGGSYSMDYSADDNSTFTTSGTWIYDNGVFWGGNQQYTSIWNGSYDYSYHEQGNLGVGFFAGIGHGGLIVFPPMVMFGAFLVGNGTLTGSYSFDYDESGEGDSISTGDLTYENGSLSSGSTSYISNWEDNYVYHFTEQGSASGPGYSGSYNRADNATGSETLHWSELTTIANGLMDTEITFDWDESGDADTSYHTDESWNGSDGNGNSWSGTHNVDSTADWGFDNSATGSPEDYDFTTTAYANSAFDDQSSANSSGPNHSSTSTSIHHVTQDMDFTGSGTVNSQGLTYSSFNYTNNIDGYSSYAASGWATIEATTVSLEGGGGGTSTSSTMSWTSNSSSTWYSHYSLIGSGTMGTFTLDEGSTSTWSWSYSSPSGSSSDSGSSSTSNHQTGEAPLTYGGWGGLYFGGFGGIGIGGASFVNFGQPGGQPPAAPPAAMGQWDIKRKFVQGTPNPSVVDAVAVKGSTVNTLAKQLGLDPNEFKNWLTLKAGGLKLADGTIINNIKDLKATDEIAAGEKVGVPNTVLMLWLGELTDAGGKPVTGWGADRDWLQKQGYNVQVTEYNPKHKNPLDKEGILGLIKTWSKGKSLYGFIVTGHGNPLSFADKTGAIVIGYKEIMDLLQYRMGLVILNVCEGGWSSQDKDVPVPTLVDGKKKMEIWKKIPAGGKDLVAPDGYFGGIKETLIPVLETMHPKDILKGSNTWKKK